MKKKPIIFLLPLTFGHPALQSLTVHYIDTEWNLQSHCLQANYMPEDHTGEKLQDALIMSFDEWNLDSSKLVAISWPVNC